MATSTGTISSSGIGSGLNVDDIVAKFTNLATHVVSRPQADAIVDWILDMEKQSDAASLARLLART